MKTPDESTAGPNASGTMPVPHCAGDPQLPAADATALSLVVLLVFCVACFAWGAAVLGRRVRESGGHANAEDGGSPPDPTEEKPASEQRSAWERAPDWWR